jgi:hypothetical protein
LGRGGLGLGREGEEGGEEQEGREAGEGHESSCGWTEGCLEISNVGCLSFVNNLYQCFPTIKK